MSFLTILFPHRRHVHSLSKPNKIFLSQSNASTGVQYPRSTSVLPCSLIYFFYTLSDTAVYLFVETTIPTQSFSRPGVRFISFIIILLAPTTDPSTKQTLREFCESVNQYTDDCENTAQTLGGIRNFFLPETQSETNLPSLTFHRQFSKDWCTKPVYTGLN